MRLKRDTLIQNHTPGATLAKAPLADWPERVIQFGEGNFLRAFVDWMIDHLNEAKRFGGRVVVVQPIASGLVDVLNDQDGLYTLLLRGIEAGKVTEQRRLITALSRGIDPYTQWEAYLGCAENPDLRIVVSNTTEAGIAYLEEAWNPDRCPTSFPAKLTALLYRRFTHFDGAADKGLLILPCELIDKNGQHLREIVLRLIKEWGLPMKFAGWVESHNVFFNTLVDRIVTGYPKDEAAKLEEELGYQDRLLDTGELFHLWVIEGDTQYRRELPLADIGLNVVWTEDLTPYRERKVRVLNGTHTLTVPVALLSGIETVKAAVEDPQVGDFMRRAVFSEILPHLDLPQAEKEAFANSVLERFANPFIHHRWIDIALNSISKFKTRCLPTLEDYTAATGGAPALMSFSLAALIRLYKEVEVRDDESVIDFFREVWKTQKGEDRGGSEADCQAICHQFLAKTAFWDRDLNDLTGLTTAASEALFAIQTQGLPAALATVLDL
jgi:tagaturonate reductase